MGLCFLASVIANFNNVVMGSDHLYNHDNGACKVLIKALRKFARASHSGGERHQAH